MKKYLLLSIMLVAALGVMAQLSPGDNAPDFTLKNVDGKMISLSDFEDQKGAIVIFTCNGCPVSKAYESRIIDLDNKYSKQGFPVIAINPNDPEMAPADSYENMQTLAAEKSYPFPYLFDENQTVFPEYGATRTPHTFLLVKDNDEFKVAYVGSIDDDKKKDRVEESFLEDAIAAVNNGQTPKIQETKAIGCGIKKKR